MTMWCPGDLAVCINDNGWHYPRRFLGFKLWRSHSNGPTKGQVCKVVTGAMVDGECFLGFAPWKGHGFIADQFRKVVPDKHEACDEEFKRSLTKKDAEV